MLSSFHLADVVQNLDLLAIGSTKEYSIVSASSDRRAVNWINALAADLGIPSQNTSSLESEELDPWLRIRP